MRVLDIASSLDSTNLKPEAREIDIEALCREAVKYKMAAVCIHPYRLAGARRLLTDSRVKLCTVIGFPLGADRLDSKTYAAAKALDDGADELDMVINIGAVKDSEYSKVMMELEAVLALKKQQNFILKVIVETALLTSQELAKITECISSTDADYIKTSTGFSSRGVSLEDIEIIRNHKSEYLQIKASGGIRELDFALELLRAGASRLGTSNARQLIEEYSGRGRQ
jgi:deoxyribose-phosphate aldolase